MIDKINYYYVEKGNEKFYTSGVDMLAVRLRLAKKYFCNPNSLFIHRVSINDVNEKKLK